MPSIAALDRRCFLKPVRTSAQAADTPWFREDRPVLTSARVRDGGERATPERKVAPAAA
jgi:hypothetical protein